MALKYHINPKVGIPTICRAKDGNCPYGGPESHYDSFEEAQRVSQEKFESEYMVLPVSEGELYRKYSDDDEFRGAQSKSFFFFKERRARREEERIMAAKERKVQEELEKNRIAVEKRKEELRMHKELVFKDLEAEFNREHPAPKLDPDKDIGHSIVTMEDPKALLDIINGVHYPDQFDKALQNPNLPRDFIDDVINNPNKYTEDVRIHLARNPSLNSDDVAWLYEKDESYQVKLLAARHPNIDYNYAKSIIESKSDKLNESPYCYFFFNPKLNDLTAPFRERYEGTLEVHKRFSNQADIFHKDWKVYYEEEASL